MTFDAKSLLTAPLPPDLTVDGLVAALVQLQAMGMGGIGIRVDDGTPVNVLELVAKGDTPAHFVLRKLIM